MESEPIRQKEQLTPKKLTFLKEQLTPKKDPFQVLFLLVLFGLCIVTISYILSFVCFPNEIMQGTDIFVTAILGSAVTIVTLSQISNKEKDEGKEGK